MKSIEISNSVRALRDQGRSLHEISRLLNLSRNTVRRILRVKDAPVAPAAMDAALQQRLKDVYTRACRATRADGADPGERLRDGTALHSTLTR